MCPIITSNWRENFEILAIFMCFFENFLKLPFSIWNLQKKTDLRHPKAYFYYKPHSWGQKYLFCLFILALPKKNARQWKKPAYCTDLSQGGPFFWTHPVKWGMYCIGQKIIVDPLGLPRDYCRMDWKALAFFSKLIPIEIAKYGTNIICASPNDTHFLKILRV